jgi:hypothetical protein
MTWQCLAGARVVHICRRVGVPTCTAFKISQWADELDSAAAAVSCSRIKWMCAAGGGEVAVRADVY